MSNSARPDVIVLGTRNRKKRVELEALLRPHSIELRTLDDYPHSIEIDEDGQTFAENARKKAREQAHVLGTWVLAEDSGLCVDALDGAPGVYSARFSGPKADDASNNRLLLARLGDCPWESRGAHYTCHAVLVRPNGQIACEACGICRGRIRFDASGHGGFGYDPLFEVLEYHRTFGELGPELKSVISHRGRALRELLRSPLFAM